ncbi:MAG: FAD binding domain-containing protein, partial [Planctomycetota bacterium]
ETVIDRDEILVAIHFPRRKKPVGSAFFKLGARKAYEIAIVSAAAALSMDGDRIDDAKVVLGSVAPVPFTAEKASAYLRGKRAGEKVFDKAARVAMQEVQPIDDFRGSATYRALMVKTMTHRALVKAYERLVGPIETQEK